MNSFNTSYTDKEEFVYDFLSPMKGQYLYLNKELSYIEYIKHSSWNNQFSIITIKDNKKTLLSTAKFYDMYYSNKINFVKSIKSNKTTYVLNDYYILNNKKVQLTNILKPYNENDNNKLNLNEPTNRIALDTNSEYKTLLTLEKADEILTHSKNNEKSEIVNSNNNDIDYRKKYLPEFRTDDGHYVRSQGEMIIDNWLYNNNINHEYEKKIILKDEEYFADFYIKDRNLYIEYFGITNNDDYTKKAEHKKSIYKENNINCIYLYPEDLKNIQDILQKTILNNIDINQ